MTVRMAHPLFLVRHGQTAWNAARRFQGQTNIPLNATGRAQAVSNGQALLAFMRQRGYDPSQLCVMSSPLDRALETAMIVCQELGIVASVRLDERLSEQFYGEWEGLMAEEIALRYPQEWNARKDDYWMFKPSGGESGAEVRARVQSLLEECQPMTLLVGHFGSLFSALWLAMEQKTQRAVSAQEPTEVRIHQNRVYVIEKNGVLEVSKEYPAGVPFNA